MKTGECIECMIAVGLIGETKMTKKNLSDLHIYKELMYRTYY